MLRFAGLRRAQGHVAFAVPGSVISAMVSADSRRMGNGGGVGGAFQPYLDSLRQELQQRDPTLLSVVVALLAVLLTLGKEVAGGYGGCGAGGDPSSAPHALRPQISRPSPLSLGSWASLRCFETLAFPLIVWL